MNGRKKENRFGGKITIKQVFPVVLVIEFILAVIAVGVCIRPEREYSFAGEELETEYGIYLEDFLGEYGDGYYLDSSIQPEEETVNEAEALGYLTVEMPKTDIPRGTYEVVIHYAANENLNVYTSQAKYNTYQVIFDKQHIGLDPEQNSVTVWMYSPLKITDYQMSVQFGGSGYLLVNSIVVRETKEWKYVSLFIVLFVSLLIDSWFLWKKRARKELDASGETILLLGALLVVFASAPIFSFYLNGTGDLDFHLCRIEAVKQALLAGQFPVRVPGFWCDGYGYASSVFYGDLFLYFPAALRIIGFSPQSAYKLYILGINILTCFMTYYCLKKICGERLSAFMGTAVYMLVPHRLMVLYLLDAVGMYTAMAFFPAIIYGMYLIYTEAEEKKGGKHGWLWFFFGFSGLIQCHVISTFIAALFALLVCVLKIRKTLKKEVLLQFVKAAVSIVLVNLWFLLPFLDYMRFDYNMSTLDGGSWGRFASNGTFLSELMDFFPHAEGYSISAGMQWGVDTPGIEMPYTLGGGVMLALVLFVMYIICGKKKDSPVRKISGMVTGLCILALCMSTIWFPWDFLQQRSDLAAWVTGSIQFPWRFLNIAAVMGAFVAAFLIYELRRSGKEVLFYGAILSVGIMTLLSGNFFLQDYEKHSEEKYITRDGIDSWQLGNAEYMPAGTDDSTFGDGLILEEGRIEIGEYEKGDGTVTVACRNIGEGETFIDVPILYYKGYGAKDAATGNSLTVVPADSKRVRVMIPAGYEGTFTAKFESPWYWRASEVISMAAVIALVFYLWMDQRRKNIVSGCLQRGF